MRNPDRIASASSDHEAPLLHVRFCDLSVLGARSHSGYALHQQTNHCLILVEAGAYQAQLGEAVFDLKPGDALLVQTGDWHEDRCAPGNRYIGIHFQLLVGSRTVPIFRENIVPQQQLLSQVWQPGDQRIARIIASRDAALPTSPLLQDALLGEILAELLVHIDPALLAPVFLKASEDRRFVDRFLSYCQDHLADDCDVPAMAAHMGMGKRQLANRCRQLLGDSPARCYLAQRLEEARLMLGLPGATVASVAGHLGFTNPFHFSRAFKRHFGHPPSELTDSL